MQIVIHAERHIQALYAECHNTECRCAECRLCGGTFMLSVTYKSFMLSFIILNVVMLSAIYAEGHLC
jgi:hypothetical protein